nr:hypothetical protein [Tanacetum cinerariifolium]
NHYSSIIISLKIDSLFDDFAGELTLLKSIPPGIDETDCYPEEETHFIKRLLYDNSSPCPSKEFVSANFDAEIESFYPSPIPQIEEEQAAKARYWKIPACYDDDDDDDYNFASTPNEPDNSLSMGDEHLDTIPATKSDEFIKSSVENLVPIPSESNGEHECDVLTREEFKTFLNILFDFDYDFYSSDDQLFYDEDVPKKIFSNPRFDEEIIPMKID